MIVRSPNVTAAALLGWAACVLIGAGCASDAPVAPASAPDKTATPDRPKARAPAPTGTAALCPSPATKPAGENDIPRFAAGSPFVEKPNLPEAKKEKILWAKSFLYEQAPDLVVEKWLSKEPQTKGKYVLIEFWATWCPPCRRSIPLLNGFHAKYGEDIVIIGISDQTQAEVEKLKEPKIEYYSAIDTQARMKNQIGVIGIPHVIILEPREGCVIWEGFPFLKGYELTEDIIKKIISIKPQKQE